jgi:hypothetical protein
MRAQEFTKHINKSRIFENTSQLPPNVIELIKKIAQSTAAPEHKKAMIDSLITKYRDKQGVPEGFDELDAYIKDKQAVKPSGGAGIKRGSYGTGERKTSYSGKTVGLTPYGTGSAIPSNRDFGRPHSMPRAAPRGLDDYDANYRREVDEIQQGVAEDTTPADEKAIEIFAQIVADDTGYDVERINYYTYDEGLRTPSGIPVYYYSFDGDVRYVGALPGGKPTAIVNQDGEVGNRGSYIELSIGGQVEYVIKGKTLFSAADQQKIANAKPGDDEYSLVMIALDLMWGRMQHKFMEQGVAEATGDPKFDKMLKGITGKRQVAKQQKADTKQQARDAFGGMFGGGNPADSLGIRKKGVAEGDDDLDKQALDVADKLTTDKNLAKLNDMAHDSTIYRALERYFAKNNISTTIFNRVAAIVFKKLDKYGRRLSTDPRIQEQGMEEGADDFEVRLDGKTVPGPFNDFDHARNKASKLISYQKGEVAEVYVNGKLKMRLKLNTPHQHFDEHTAA